MWAIKISRPYYSSSFFPSLFKTGVSPRFHEHRAPPPPPQHAEYMQTLTSFHWVRRGGGGGGGICCMQRMTFVCILSMKRICYIQKDWLCTITSNAFNIKFDTNGTYNVNKDLVGNKDWVDTVPFHSIIWFFFSFSIQIHYFTSCTTYSSFQDLPQRLRDHCWNLRYLNRKENRSFFEIQFTFFLRLSLVPGKEVERTSFLLLKEPEKAFWWLKW